MEEEKLTETLQVRVTKGMVEGLKGEAVRRRVRVSDLVRMALSDLITPGPRPDPNRPMRNV